MSSRRPQAADLAAARDRLRGRSQRKFIEALHKDAEAQFGADLIAGDIEELRTAVHATLRKIEQPEPKQPDRAASGGQPAWEARSSIYFSSATGRTAKPAFPSASCADNRGLKYALPAFEGDASEVRKANQQHLATCDVVLLFYGAGDAAWKRASTMN